MRSGYPPLKRSGARGVTATRVLVATIAALLRRSRPVRSQRARCTDENTGRTYLPSLFTYQIEQLEDDKSKSPGASSNDALEK